MPTFNLQLVFPPLGKPKALILDNLGLTDGYKQQKQNSSGRWLGLELLLCSAEGCIGAGTASFDQLVHRGLCWRLAGGDIDPI